MTIASTVFNRLLAGATGSNQGLGKAQENIQANLAEATVWKAMAEATSYLQKMAAGVSATITKNQVAATEQLINAYA
jgi:flagellar biosynthesis/type III secretory pathway protein FliH